MGTKKGDSIAFRDFQVSAYNDLNDFFELNLFTVSSHIEWFNKNILFPTHTSRMTSLVGTEKTLSSYALH